MPETLLDKAKLALMGVIFNLDNITRDMEIYNCKDYFKIIIKPTFGRKLYREYDMMMREKNGINYINFSIYNEETMLSNKDFFFIENLTEHFTADLIEVKTIDRSTLSTNRQ